MCILGSSFEYLIELSNMLIKTLIISSKANSNSIIFSLSFKSILPFFSSNKSFTEATDFKIISLILVLVLFNNIFLFSS